jgi:cellulose synthase/poly-beta-1,6-N-acetylglucosamine synthase-like glycosyltransferase
MSYPLLLKRISRKDLTISPTDVIGDIDISEEGSDLPIVSVIIPVYNEELVIERRINNIFESSYPKEKLEIIVVDSGSKDKTRSIVEERFPNRVILVREEHRKGKAHAINLALKICKGEILIITDGPTLYDMDTINQLVSSLKNSSVGGVSALYNIPNADENQITASEHAFWSYKDKIRILESRAFSTSWLSGEACAFKKKIVTRVDEDTLADDSNIALQIISKGYRVVVNENCHFSEKSPSEVYDYIKTKARRVLGGLMETLRFKFFLFKREYGYFGIIIFPYRFFAQFVSPIVSYIAVILSIPATIETSTYFGIYGVLLMGMSLLIMGFLFRNKLTTYIYLQIITSIALLMLITKRGNVEWNQSRTTRV